MTVTIDNAQDVQLRLLAMADYLDGKDADLRAVLHFEKQLAASLGVTEPGIEPYRSIGTHFGGVPPQRSELMDRIG